VGHGREKRREREREEREKPLECAHLRSSSFFTFDFVCGPHFGTSISCPFLSFHSFSSSADAVCLFVVAVVVSKLTLDVVILSFLYRPPPLDPWSRQLEMRQQLPFSAIGMSFIHSSCRYQKSSCTALPSRLVFSVICQIFNLHF
jgi:hypothetical protein